MGYLPLMIGALLFVFLSLTQEVKGQNRAYGEGDAYEWPVRDVPNPYSLDIEQQRLCGQDSRSSVCDPNGILPKFDARNIDRAIADVYENTTCRCFECQENDKGYIIRVAILPKMKRIFPNSGNSSYMRLRDAEMYSYILTTEWNMGGLCNEALLILFSKYDDILYTLTRQLTARFISNEEIQRVSLGVRSYFDRDDTVARGILEMIRQYKALLTRP